MQSLKPKVYIETSVISFRTARPSMDVRKAAKQVVTYNWWETSESRFERFISEFVLAEACEGDHEKT